MPAGKIHRYKAKASKSKAITKKAVKNLINANIETKYYDVVSNNFTVSTLTEPFILSDVVQGDGQSERTGDILKMSNLKMNFYLRRVGGATGNDIVRCIIFKWKENSGTAVPTVARILETSSTLSFPLFDNVENVVILKDKLYYVPEATDEFNGRVSSHSINLKGSRLKQNGASAAGTGHIYALFLGLNTTAGGSYSQVNWNSRLSYKDA